MPLEVETKILEVDSAAVSARLDDLGAKKILEARMTIDWYGPKGLTHRGDDPWYVRVRSFTPGGCEISWKSLGKIEGNTRQSQEVCLGIDDTRQAGQLLLALDLEHYAHQEKDRTSWQYMQWRFDLDRYPNMPAYLEIEGESHEHVTEAIELLGLSNHTAISEGERKLISERYGLDWNQMSFGSKVGS